MVEACVNIQNTFMRTLLAFLLAVVIASCQQSSDGALSMNAELQGSWLLYEYGYSPGGGYIINPVPENPPQTIAFLGDKNFRSTLQGQLDYKFYSITEDTVKDVVTLRLFKNEDAMQPPFDDSKVQVYYLTMEGSTLKLHGPGCIEGCHWGFRRIASAND
jgi:hypothetical protein